MANDRNHLDAVPAYVRHAVAATRNLLLWFAGLPAEAVRGHRADVQMRYTGMGLLVLTWYTLMLIVWAKTGAHYAGKVGSLAYCLAPTIMLALDRLIIGQMRSPAGELSAYAIADLRPHRSEYVMRVFAALAFSAVSTQVFLVTNSEPEIRALQQREQEKANAPLRQELAARVEAATAERTRTISQRSAELDAQAALLRDDLAKARAIAEEAESRMREANINVASEIGGLDGRRHGKGVRHDAYALIVQQSTDAAVNSRGREMRARDALGKVQVERQQLAAERERTAALRNDALSNLDAAMQGEVRYVRRKQGLFADASALLRLYADPEIGPGLLLTTVLAIAMLFVLETSPLLGLRFLPTTPVDIERITLNRADAARLVAQHELDLMSSASRRDVRVRPATPQDRRSRPSVHEVDEGGAQ